VIDVFDSFSLVRAGQPYSVLRIHPLSDLGVWTGRHPPEATKQPNSQTAKARK
jgi:hypothetical protein